MTQRTRTNPAGGLYARPILNVPLPVLSPDEKTRRGKREKMETPELELDEAIRIEGALDFIGRGFTKAQHVDCYKPQYRKQEARSWDAAVALVKRFGTVRKATNYANRQIELYR